ncbi:MAG TPA: TolC family protein [Thermoanaerobaculia bacterium]|nr:TolC family protein [Thermoanaerobaculia bacterium]
MLSKAPGAALAAALALATATTAPAALTAQHDPPPVSETAQGEEHAHAAPVSTWRLEREALIHAVLAENPGLTAARRALAAARERVPQATSLDDPMLAYGFGPLSIASDDVRFGQTIEARQRFPYPGTLRLRGEAARADADAAAQDLETVRLELATAASLLYDDYYLVHRALAINAEHVRLLEDFQRIATARYAAGEAPQQAPIQAEVELAHLVHRDMVLETTREVLAARLNALLHREPGAPLPPPVDRLALPELEAPDPARLEELALAARPELARLTAERAAREAMVSLRRLDRYPEFEAMASYNSMWMDTAHQWMVGVAVNLPVWRGRIEAGVAEAEAEAARVESERARLADEVRAEARIAWSRLREAHHVLTLYESRLVPAARDQVRAALAGFETGQVSFLALIEAERNQRTVELQYEETLAGLHRHRAELARALGRLPVEMENQGAER